MRIGYFIAGIQPSHGGVYQYAILVLKLLVSMNSVQSITIVYSEEQKSMLKKTVGNSSNVNFALYPPLNWWQKLLYKMHFLFLFMYWFTEKKRPWLRKMYMALQPNREFLAKLPIDLLHLPVQFAPAHGFKFPVIITMHDLLQFHYPQFFPYYQRSAKELVFAHTLYDASHIVVSFDHVREDILKFYPMAPDRISVCRAPVHSDWMTKDKVLPMEHFSDRYGIENEFLLTPAATWEHKNHITLLKAIHKLKLSGKRVYLVCTGHKMPYFEKIQYWITRLELEKEVCFTGIVSSEELYSLYCQTRLVVIPTLYEAGSGPLFEAMKLNVPVICSNVTSLPETIGNEDFVFDPRSVDDLAGKIHTHLSNPLARENNIRNSRERANYYITIDYAADFSKVFNKILSEKPDNQKIVKLNHYLGRRKTIAGRTLEGTSA